MENDKWISERSDGWYYHDETGDLTGPFTTIEAARSAFASYCEWLEQNPEADGR